MHFLQSALTWLKYVLPEHLQLVAGAEEGALVRVGVSSVAGARHHGSVHVSQNRLACASMPAPSRCDASRAARISSTMLSADGLSQTRRRHVPWHDQLRLRTRAADGAGCTELPCSAVSAPSEPSRSAVASIRRCCSSSKHGAPSGPYRTAFICVGPETGVEVESVGQRMTHPLPGPCNTAPLM